MKLNNDELRVLALKEASRISPTPNERLAVEMKMSAAGGVMTRAEKEYNEFSKWAHMDNNDEYYYIAGFKRALETAAVFYKAHKREFDLWSADSGAEAIRNLDK